ncbi:MAG: hypothetical protein O7B35_05705 [Deltaproteobacteria bacterium]|nr:hypothetical protein [Deltaproteobacteria bacterium]
MRCQKLLPALLIFLLASIFTTFSLHADPSEMTWTRSRILSISDQEASRLKYDVDTMSVSFNIHNSQWNRYLKSLEGIGGLPDVEDKLKGRDFWAVYYGPLKRQFGGDLWVFVDRDSTDIITVIRGE